MTYNKELKMFLGNEFGLYKNNSYILQEENTDIENNIATIFSKLSGFFNVEVFRNNIVVRKISSLIRENDSVKNSYFKVSLLLNKKVVLLFLSYDLILKTLENSKASMSNFRENKNYSSLFFSYYVVKKILEIKSKYKVDIKLSEVEYIENIIQKDLLTEILLEKKDVFIVSSSGDANSHNILSYVSIEAGTADFLCSKLYISDIKLKMGLKIKLVGSSNGYHLRLNQTIKLDDACLFTLSSESLTRAIGNSADNCLLIGRFSKARNNKVLIKIEKCNNG